MYVLRILHNQRGPFVVATAKRAALHLVLWSCPDGALVRLKVRNGDQEYELERIGLGDTLRFEYDASHEAVAQTIEELAAETLGAPVPALAYGHRIALEIIEVPAAARSRLSGVLLSYPEHGSVSIVLGTVPRDHGRVFASATNDQESWHWQLLDLYAGEAVAFRVVETTQGSVYPIMKAADPEDDVTGIAILARRAPPGTLHLVRHVLHFPSEDAALAANAKLSVVGFGTEKPRGADDAWFIDVTERMVPTEAALASARAKLQSAIGEIKYGGWEAQLIEEPPPA